MALVQQPGPAAPGPAGRGWRRLRAGESSCCAGRRRRRWRPTRRHPPATYGPLLSSAAVPARVLRRLQACAHELHVVAQPVLQQAHPQVIELRLNNRRAGEASWRRQQVYSTQAIRVGGSIWASAYAATREPCDENKEQDVRVCSQDRQVGKAPAPGANAPSLCAIGTSRAPSAT